MMKLDYDVAIVGYGPVGQTVAALLGGAGHRVGVFERFGSLYDLPRAVHFDHEIMRVWQCARHRQRDWRRSAPDPRIPLVRRRRRTCTGTMSRLTNRWRWSEIRAAVLRRDRYRCRECGSGADLEVHHDDARLGDAMSNLVTLCHGCHPR